MAITDRVFSGNNVSILYANGSIEKIKNSLPNRKKTREAISIYKTL